MRNVSETVDVNFNSLLDRRPCLLALDVVEKTLHVEQKRFQSPFVWLSSSLLLFHHRHVESGKVGGCAKSCTLSTSSASLNCRGPG